MKHVHAPNNIFKEFALSGEVIEFSSTCKTTAKRLTPEQAVEYGVSKLQLVTPPYSNPLSQIRTEADPLLVDGVWVQQWAVTDLDATTTGGNLITGKEERQDTNRTACTAAILTVYPEPIQRSASLGVYPGDYITTMTSFIAACIAEENRVFNLLEAATTVAEIDAIELPTWPIGV